MRDILTVLCHSDKTSKHFDLQCLHNAKGTMHFWRTDYLYELLQVNHVVVLNHPGYFGKSTKSVENVWSVSRNEQMQLKSIFCLLVTLTIYMGKEFNFEA